MNHDPYDSKEEVYTGAFEERTPFVTLTGRPERNNVINDDDILNLKIALALNAI